MRRDALRVDAVLYKYALHGVGSVPGKHEVVLARAGGVSVPLDVDLEHVGVCEDEVCDLLADGPAHVPDARAVRVEMDDVIEEDLVADQTDLIPGGRAPIRPGICRPDAGDVR